MNLVLKMPKIALLILVRSFAGNTEKPKYRIMISYHSAPSFEDLPGKTSGIFFVPFGWNAGMHNCFDSDHSCIYYALNQC